MKVREIASSAPRMCSPDSNLAEAGCLMWEEDCGILPVTDPEGRLLGVITDRDVCIAVSTREGAASGMTVREVMTTDAAVCTSVEDVKTALATMRDRQIRRLPVISEDGRLQGMLSVNDVILAAKLKPKKGEIGCSEILPVLQTICRHRKERQPVAEAVGAGAS